jgi:hypothetical protein
MSLYFILLLINDCEAAGNECPWHGQFAAASSSSTTLPHKWLQYLPVPGIEIDVAVIQCDYLGVHPFRQETRKCQA